jgi:hypothetical protein
MPTSSDATPAPTRMDERNLAADTATCGEGRAAKVGVVAQRPRLPHFAFWEPRPAQASMEMQMMSQNRPWPGRIIKDKPY